MGRGRKLFNAVPPPVEKIEVPEGHTGRRLIAAALFLLIAAVAVGYGVLHLVRTPPGWQEIQANTQEISCAGDFTLLYELGAEGASATAEARALPRLYGQACVDAYRIFNSAESFTGVENLHALNLHPNEIRTVAQPLYDALALLDRYSARFIYLGPAYELYNGAFFCEEDRQVTDFDPTENADLGAYFGEIAAFARNRDSVDLELLGDCRVRLKVSEEYLSFAAENGASRFVDLSWSQNAFIIDYLADVLGDAGYSCGVLSSADGFVRNLDGRDVGYTMNLFAWEDGRAVSAAAVSYTGPCAAAALRGYPVPGDGGRVCLRDSGALLTPYLTVENGLPAGAGRDLLGWSRDTGCGELLLKLLPHFLADTPEAARTLTGTEGTVLWCRDRTICTAGAPVALDHLREGYRIQVK